MSFEIKELLVGSTDNIHTLNGRIYIPEGEPKGVLHIVHGMTEYIDRYDPLMSYLADKGFVCFGFDNLGHGKTAKDNSELGFIAHSDGWKYLINDVGQFAKTVKKIYPDKDFFLLGHSMGSFIARLSAVKFNNLYKKLIICGTGGKNPLAPAGLMITSIIKAVKGEKHVSQTVKNMAFGGYNKRFDGKTGREWLASDSSVIAKYAIDKFCNYDFTVSAMHDLIKLNSVCNKKQWYSETSQNMPILIISGKDDPVGNYGKGPEEIYKKLVATGKDVKLKLYENARHEIHNDFCREEVWNDILQFIR